MSTVLMSNTAKPRKYAHELIFSQEHFGGPIFGVRGSYYGFLIISGEPDAFEGVYKYVQKDSSLTCFCSI